MGPGARHRSRPSAEVDGDGGVLLDGLLTVFRRYGYEGATLTRFVAATGLQRSSLYHRFPEGKAQMAAAVIAHAEAQLDRLVVAPLRAVGPLDRRLAAARSGLHRFYDDGRRSCLLDTLSVGTEDDVALQRRLRATADRLLEALAGVAREAGRAPEDAAARAQQALVDIEGAVVLARVTGSTTVFRDVLDRLPGLLLDPR